MRKIQPKRALRGLPLAPVMRGSSREGRLARSRSVDLCVYNSESYCVRRSRGYFNCLATGELLKLDGLLLPVSVSQIAVFALRYQTPCTLPLDFRWVSGPAPCCFFSVMGYSIKYKYTPYGGPLIKSWGGVKENLSQGLLSQGVTLVDVVSQGVGGGIVVIIVLSPGVSGSVLCLGS